MKVEHYIGRRLGQVAVFAEGKEYIESVVGEDGYKYQLWLHDQFQKWGL